MVTIPGYDIGEPLHRSQRRTIYAATRIADGAQLAIKTHNSDYPSRNDIAALTHEFEVTQRLQHIPGVVRTHALERYGTGGVALVLERCGPSLAERRAAAPAGRLPLATFFSVAIAAAETLAGVHECDVVHKNIEPRSLLIDEAGQLRLIDFAIASELSLERQHHALLNRLEGALPYISPEQTGRMNRDLDYRSDYYSLGVTLYELLTGRLPFAAESVLEWVHSHIGRAPPAPTEVDSAIPEAVSAILLKLLSKNAEDRYQSSFGLIHDLTQCQRALEQTGSIAPFTLGGRDVSRRFQIPQKLYGRESELAMLLSMFEQVVAGGAEFCMVSGYSGIGKSALVNELNKPLVRQKGYLIEGKFDQFQRNTPYSAVTAAFRSLVQQLLEEPAERQQALRAKLIEALGANGQLLVDMLPELELIIGPQPVLPALPQTETQNRFHITFLSFVRVITSEQPLVVFLDDLQFGDVSTFNLLRWLAGARDLSHLLVIGAYRSNEVDVGHPLRLALDEMEDARPIHDLLLRPLDLGSTTQLIVDTLHSSPTACAALSALLHENAQGNPFFLTEMLKMLHQERAIVFAPEEGRWRWDMDAVRRTGLSGDVVELMVANLRKLDPPTQKVLQLAACIGNTFDLRTLAVIYESPIEAAAAAVNQALQRHVIVPLNDDYKLVGAAGTAGDTADGAPLNPIYKFQHDRVQQAAYALIDSDDRQAVHLSVGRLIQQHASDEERQHRLIDIVGHLNEGRRLIEDAEERLGLARLNLAAGVQAQQSSAYDSALDYLRIGHELLPADAWASHYDLTMALAAEYQQCAYLTARADEAEAWIEQMLARARSNLEKAEILSQRTRQYATTGKMEASIDAALMGLSLIGMGVTGEIDAAMIRRERAAARRHLGRRAIGDLIDAPPLTDRAKVVAIRLLMEIFPAAFLSGNGALLPFIVLRSVNLSLRYGNSPESAFAYAAYGMLLCGSLEDPALGFEYGQLAVTMNDRFADIGLKSRVIYVYAMFIHHWSRHWSSMTPWFRRGIESGYQSGDMLYLAYSAQDCIIWDPKLDLEAAAREHANYLTIVRDCAYQDSLDSGTLFLQLQRSLMGLTDGPLSLSDDGFDEDLCVAAMLDRKFITGVANYRIYKSEIAWFHGDLDEALAQVREQDKLIASAMSLPQLVRFNIVAFLTLTAALPRMPPDEQETTRARLAADLRRMRRWAANCPENFLHLELTMRGELARLEGRVDAALRLYEQAMAAAQASEFRRDEGVANELAARHLLAASRPKAAEGYLRAARQIYERWGARRKVALLDAEFAAMLQPSGNGWRGDGDNGSHPAVGIDAASLDMASVMKATQAISGEIVLEQLWATTMHAMLENAGAQRGCFVIRRDGQLLIEGLSDVDGAADAVAGGIVAESAEGVGSIPGSIVFHVLHTNTPVVLNDVEQSGRFARDPYIRARSPRSILCIPLVRQGKFEGAIYMENSLATGVFTEDRIEVIRLLAAQASISIENAKLYEDQTRLIEAQRRFVPSQFLEGLDRHDIARVTQGEHVAKTMSIMFTDLRDFTPLAEKLDPRSVIELLNRYFVSMEPEILAAGGFIDSFSGDEIRALFEGVGDAPLRAGIGMRRALAEFNARSAAFGQPQLQFGIGVNSGPVVLGVVGGADRIQCSVIGDAVNLASRIEQLTKVYQARFLIGEATLAGLTDPAAFDMRPVDRVAVKGKHTAVRLYEVLDAESPERRAAKAGTREGLEAAMDLYYRGDFSAAGRAFAALCREDPLDAVPRLFAERCQRYCAAPPPEDWGGFEQLDHK